MKIICTSMLSLFLLAPTAFASQEGVLSLEKFRVESQGIGESGPVVVTGEKNKQGEFAFLKLEAFGKTYELTKEDLKQIPKLLYNGIQLSYEGGHYDLGGRTIYIMLQMGSAPGIQKKVLISITEKGSIKIEQQNKI